MALTVQILPLTIGSAQPHESFIRTTSIDMLNYSTCLVYGDCVGKYSRSNENTMKGPLNYWSALVLGIQLSLRHQKLLDELECTVSLEDSRDKAYGATGAHQCVSYPSSRITTLLWSWWRLWRNSQPLTLWLILMWSSTMPLHWIGKMTIVTACTIQNYF